MMVRSVVTGHSNGKALVVFDSRTPRSHDFVDVRGMSTALDWSTPPVASLLYGGNDVINRDTTFIPPPGETRLMVVSFPPDSLAMTPVFDGAAAGRESAEQFPDIAAKMEAGQSRDAHDRYGRLRYRARARGLA
jgi:hypothetical protein